MDAFITAALELYGERGQLDTSSQVCLSGPSSLAVVLSLACLTSALHCFEGRFWTVQLQSAGVACGLSSGPARQEMSNEAGIKSFMHVQTEDVDTFWHIPCVATRVVQQIAVAACDNQRGPCMSLTGQLANHLLPVLTFLKPCRGQKALAAYQRRMQALLCTIKPTDEFSCFAGASVLGKGQGPCTGGLPPALPWQAVCGCCRGPPLHLRLQQPQVGTCFGL